MLAADPPTEWCHSSSTLLVGSLLLLCLERDHQYWNNSEKLSSFFPLLIWLMGESFHTLRVCRVICPSWVSAPFWVSNGVRRGILSPILFNLYMDELSECLNICKTGCMIGNTLANPIIYADYLVVFSPSSAGLQQLLTLCSDYGHEHYILSNPDKSVVMICRTKEDKSIHFPVFKLSNKTRVSLYVWK